MIYAWLLLWMKRTFQILWLMHDYSYEWKYDWDMTTFMSENSSQSLKVYCKVIGELTELNGK